MQINWLASLCTGKTHKRNLLMENICQNWLKYLPEDELFLKSCFYGINDSEKSLSLVSSQWHSWMLLPFQISNTPWTENYSKSCWMKMCSRENHYNYQKVIILPVLQVPHRQLLAIIEETASLTWSITAFIHIWLEGFQEPHKKVVFIRPAELLVGF